MMKKGNVEYTIDGQEYHNQSKYPSISYNEGDEVVLYYHSNHPEKADVIEPNNFALSVGIISIISAITYIKTGAKKASVVVDK